MSEISLRIATPLDAADLLEIYAYYVEHTAITFEYTVPSLEEFEERIRHTLQRYPYIVAEEKGHIIGYVYAGAFKSRAAYDWCVETSIYVHKDHKKRGLGKLLYEALERILKAQNILNLNACIAYSAKEDAFLTKDSVFFHEKMGYRMVGEFHQCGYKVGRWYNMVWMEKMVGEHLDHQPPVIPFPDLEQSMLFEEKQHIL